MRRRAVIGRAKNSIRSSSSSAASPRQRRGTQYDVVETHRSAAPRRAGPGRSAPAEWSRPAGWATGPTTAAGTLSIRGWLHPAPCGANMSLVTRHVVSSVVVVLSPPPVSACRSDAQKTVCSLAPSARTTPPVVAGDAALLL